MIVLDRRAVDVIALTLAAIGGAQLEQLTPPIANEIRERGEAIFAALYAAGFVVHRRQAQDGERPTGPKPGAP